MKKTIAFDELTHKNFVKHEGRLSVSSEDKITHNNGIKDLMDKSVALVQLKPIVKDLREYVEAFKKRAPKVDKYGHPVNPEERELFEEYDKRSMEILNDLESLIGNSISVWSKEENGNPMLIPKSEVKEN